MHVPRPAPPQSTPSFYFFQNGQQVHSHAGGNVERFRTAIESVIGPAEMARAEPAVTSD